MTDDQAHQFTVVLEDVQKSLAFLAEGHGTLVDGLSRLDRKVDALGARLDLRLERVESQLGILDTRVERIEHHLDLNGAPAPRPKTPRRKR